jgi:hypothetical protein
MIAQMWLSLFPGLLQMASEVNGWIKAMSGERLKVTTREIPKNGDKPLKESS